MLKVEVETLSPIRRRLRVEVPQEQVVAEMERAYNDLSRRARVPGFRQGRAPRSVLERQFGDHVRSEVFGKLIQESLTQAVEQEDITVVGSPQIETEQAQPGQPLRYSATLEVYPDVTAQGYDALDLERPLRAVTADDVERYLGELRESLAQLRPVEERTVVERGDVVTLDYQAECEGRVVGRGENRPCEIGKGSYPPGFEDRLVGANVGESLDFELEMPEDYGVGGLAGKRVSFHATVRSLAEKEVPELDDDFAKDHGECDTLEQLRERIRVQLDAAATRQADERLRAAAVAKVVDAQAEIELPAAMVGQRLQQLMTDVVEEWRARRIWPQDEQAALASLRQDLEPRAAREVKTALVLDSVARHEGVEVLEADVEDEVARLAAGAGEAGDRVRSLYATAEAREGLRARLRRQRAVDLLVNRARVRDVPWEAATVVAGPGESR